jgi:anaerobic ribonucleoside-triphosphate reductase activating protein
MPIILNLHAIIPSSRVNGPGTRSVIFFQGCARACAGCFNPETHDFSLNKARSVDEVLMAVPQGAEGLTISGGEPFVQPQGLKALLTSARQTRGLSIIIYTGFTLEELRADKARAAVLPLIDVLVAGPFEIKKTEKTALARGSTNQTFHFLSERYNINDLYLPARLEVTIGVDGSLTGTGFSSITSLSDNI